MYLESFIKYLLKDNKSMDTIKIYISDVKKYFKWFENKYNHQPKILFSENILDYKNYLFNTVKNNAKTINRKLYALKKYNLFLIDYGIQSELAVKDNYMFHIQQEYVSPTKITESDVEEFLQQLLEHADYKYYAIANLLRYTGLRISEALNIKMSDFNLTTRECIIRHGKGTKQRIIFFNNKVVEILKKYIKIRSEYPTNKSPYLFISKTTIKLSRITVNRVFNRYSKIITPHQLRHFFCTNALEHNMAVHEIAYLVGHTNIHTTLLYTNPNTKNIKDKLEEL